MRIALGDYSDAVSDAERALAIEPADSGHAYALGEAHKLLHHTVEARNAYRKATAQFHCALRGLPFPGRERHVIILANTGTADLDEFVAEIGKRVVQ